jgi:hypothetical protein
VTFKDLQKLIESQPDHNNPEQSKLERLRDKAFWHALKFVERKRMEINAMQAMEMKASEMTTTATATEGTEEEEATTADTDTDTETETEGVF